MKISKKALLVGSSVLGVSVIVLGTSLGLSSISKATAVSKFIGFGGMNNAVQHEKTFETESETDAGEGFVSETEAGETLSDLKSLERKLELKLVNDESASKYGTLTFVDEEGNSLSSERTVVPGDKIIVKLELKDPETYTLTDLKVYDGEMDSVCLGVKKEVGREEYSFTMPEEGSKFYKTGKISIKGLFDAKSKNKWEFDFESRAYVITNSGDSGLVLGAGYELVSGEVTNPVQYRFYLNDKDVTIESLTVPSGTQLMFINNKSDSNKEEFKKPEVKFKTGGSFELKGAIGRYASVEYSKEFAMKLGIPGIY